MLIGNSNFSFYDRHVVWQELYKMWDENSTDMKTFIVTLAYPFINIAFIEDVTVFGIVRE
jgi:hypothetical protein